MTASQTGSPARGRAGAFAIKRAYEAPAARDGTRVLIDRLWPRGLRKDKASIDVWMKEIAPSAGLRRWFHHDPARWSEFRQRYNKELEGKADLVDHLRRLTGRGTVTLLFAAHDADHNHAVVLLRFLVRKRG